MSIERTIKDIAENRISGDQMKRSSGTEYSDVIKKKARTGDIDLENKQSKLASGSADDSKTYDKSEPAIGNMDQNPQDCVDGVPNAIGGDTKEQYVGDPMTKCGEILHAIFLQMLLVWEVTTKRLYIDTVERGYGVACLDIARNTYIANMSKNNMIIILGKVFFTNVSSMSDENLRNKIYKLLKIASLKNYLDSFKAEIDNDKDFESFKDILYPPGSNNFVEFDMINQKLTALLITKNSILWKTQGHLQDDESYELFHKWTKDVNSLKSKQDALTINAKSNTYKDTKKQKDERTKIMKELDDEFESLGIKEQIKDVDYKKRAESRCSGLLRLVSAATCYIELKVDNKTNKCTGVLVGIDNMGNGYVASAFHPFRRRLHQLERSIREENTVREQKDKIVTKNGPIVWSIGEADKVKREWSATAEFICQKAFEREKEKEKRTFFEIDCYVPFCNDKFDFIILKLTKKPEQPFPTHIHLTKTSQSDPRILDVFGYAGEWKLSPIVAIPCAVFTKDELKEKQMFEKMRNFLRCYDFNDLQSGDPNRKRQNCEKDIKMLESHEGIYIMRTSDQMNGFGSSGGPCISDVRVESEPQSSITCSAIYLGKRPKNIFKLFKNEPNSKILEDQASVEIAVTAEKIHSEINQYVTEQPLLSCIFGI